MSATASEIVAAARAETERMRLAVNGRDKSDKVFMQAGQFAILADLIHALCDNIALPAEESFGNVRYWVPLAAHQRLLAIARSAEAERAKLSWLNCPTVSLSI
jgi:hypothetical protein